LSLIGIFLVAMINFLIDPLQQYRLANFYKPIYGNGRFFNPGFIRNSEYDSILIGSSMVDNFIPSRMNRTFSIKILKLSVLGATAYEENLTLKTVFEAKKAKNVFLSLDMYSLAGAAKRFRYGADSFPSYLYNPGIINRLKYLLNADILFKYNGQTIAANIFGIRKKKLDPDTANYFGDSKTFSKETVMNLWRKKEFSHGATIKDSTYEMCKNSFDANLLPHFVNNPGVQFYIFSPPYSILAWVDMKDKGILEDFLQTKKYIFGKCRDLKNVKLYDFQDEERIILNLDNYCDITHYSPEINEFIMKSMLGTEYLVSAETVDRHIGNLRKLVVKFDEALRKDKI
jgi:hypothetical protein